MAFAVIGCSPGRGPVLPSRAGLRQDPPEVTWPEPEPAAGCGGRAGMTMEACLCRERCVLVPGVLVPGVLVPGVLVAGVLVPGVLVPGVLAPAVACWANASAATAAAASPAAAARQVIRPTRRSPASRWPAARRESYTGIGLSLPGCRDAAPAGAGCGHAG
jgi:hypothetical protein